MRVYARPEDGLADALNLSGAMTRKFAVCDVACGGGKGVLAVPRLFDGAERIELLHRYGDFITSLGGLYATAPDMNTSERDMDVIAERCEYVVCRSVDNGGSGATAPATARGVFYGIRASVEFKLGRDLDGVRVLVQGIGAVGALLAQRARSRRAPRCSSPTSIRRGSRASARRPRGRDRHRVRRLRAVRGRRRRSRRRPSSGCAAASSRARPTTSSPTPRSPTACTSAASSTRPTT